MVRRSDGQLWDMRQMGYSLYCITTFVSLDEPCIRGELLGSDRGPLGTHDCLSPTVKLPLYCYSIFLNDLWFHIPHFRLLRTLTIAIQTRSANVTFGSQRDDGHFLSMIETTAHVTPFFFDITLYIS